MLQKVKRGFVQIVHSGLVKNDIKTLAFIPSYKL